MNKEFQRLKEEYNTNAVKINLFLIFILNKYYFCLFFMFLKLNVDKNIKNNTFISQLLLMNGFALVFSVLKNL